MTSCAVITAIRDVAHKGGVWPICSWDPPNIFLCIQRCVPRTFVKGLLCVATGRCGPRPAEAERRAAGSRQERPATQGHYRCLQGTGEGEHKEKDMDSKARGRDLDPHLGSWPTSRTPTSKCLSRSVQRQSRAGTRKPGMTLGTGTEGNAGAVAC